MYVTKKYIISADKETGKTVISNIEPFKLFYLKNEITTPQNPYPIIISNTTIVEGKFRGRFN